MYISLTSLAGKGSKGLEICPAKKHRKLQYIVLTNYLPTICSDFMYFKKTMKKHEGALQTSHGVKVFHDSDIFLYRKFENYRKAG